MIRNYFRIAFRNLIRNKVHSFINIAGLSIGMAVALLIGLWIWDEFSYEKYNSNYDRVAQVMQSETFNGERDTHGSMPVPLAAELHTTYGSTFQQVVISWWLRNHILSWNDKKFTEKGRFMGPEAPELLSLNMLKGTRDGLNDPSSILLSASVATALFGDADPMNKQLKIDNKLTVKVTGVYKDLPHNSKFNELMFIAPWQLFASSDDLIKDIKTHWDFDAVEIYVRLADKADLNAGSTRIRDCINDKIKDSKEFAAYKQTVFLQPMSRWHLYSEFKNGVNAGGRIQFVWLFAIIGSFVLFLACINFMNLSTARSERRAKEVGIRKAIGSGKGQLIGQFFSESLLAAGLAFLFSLLATAAAIPFFNEIAEKKMTIPWNNPWFWMGTMGFTVFTGLLAGSYPAFYLSSFQPVKVLKGGFRVSKGAAVPRKILVVLQFTVSVALIIGTGIVFRQIQYAKNRSAGYDRDGLIALQMTTPDFFGKEEILRNELLQTGLVREVSESSGPTTGIWMNNSGFDWAGKDPSVQGAFATASVTPEYGKTVGWEFKEGRDFSRAFAMDSSAIVINEAGAVFTGLKNPVGERITWSGRTYRIVGVIKNMLMESPYERVRPTVFYIGKNTEANFLFVKMRPGANIRQALSQVQAVLQKYIPSAPFDYKFVDEEFAKKFGDEERTGKLAGCFALLAIFISCLGLFGMASFMAEQRIKEIGIRKVLGASVFQVWRLLSKDFVVLVTISLLIATPVAWYFMHGWLQNYEYHTAMPWWVFIATGTGAMTITLLTVSFQAIRAAVANPIKSLKTE